ncbi:MAG TPA: TetR/AcrR family transcriptional regulator [Gemmatimonadaceae bacterium]|jgi:AcrR family transcriptional regulator
MSNKSPAVVRKVESTDPRVQRSVQALGNAFVELIQEREFASITVQEILDRAGVGRATFYAHYRNKQDVLYSSYEGMFAMFERLLDQTASRGPRLVPVAEYLSHLGAMTKFIDSLRDAGQLDEIWSLGVDFVARMIEKRIAPVPNATPAIPPSLAARMLAGALMEMARWWYDHQATSTPAQMDVAFHEVARATLQRAAYRQLSAIPSR